MAMNQIAVELSGGRNRSRTCDLFLVMEALVPTELCALRGSLAYTIRTQPFDHILTLSPSTSACVHGNSRGVHRVERQSPACAHATADLLVGQKVSQPRFEFARGNPAISSA